MSVPPLPREEKAAPPPAETVARAYEHGLRLLADGEHFAAHEAFEEAWRAAQPEERDFFQGLVHVVVAWYQASRGNPVGCERQLEKAARRLARYSPEHRGLDVADVLRQVAAARGRFPDLPPLRVSPARGSPGRD
jgi:predicted metal-dependent hydrolase